MESFFNNVAILPHPNRFSQKLLFPFCASFCQICTKELLLSSIRLNRDKNIYYFLRTVKYKYKITNFSDLLLIFRRKHIHNYEFTCNKAKMWSNETYFALLCLSIYQYFQILNKMTPEATFFNITGSK